MSLETGPIPHLLAKEFISFIEADRKHSTVMFISRSAVHLDAAVI